jgi:hypothetical protein
VYIAEEAIWLFFDPPHFPQKADAISGVTDDRAHGSGQGTTFGPSGFAIGPGADDNDQSLGDLARPAAGWIRSPPMIQRPTRLLLAALLVVTVVVVMARRPILRSAGWALVAEDAVETGDVIVVPEWATDPGALEAADLVHAGIADRVAVLLVSPGPAARELARRGISPSGEAPRIVRLLTALGLEQVEQIPAFADGTETEGQVLLRWLEQRRFRSAIVVSLPDHSRRLRRVLRRSMKGGTAKVVVSSTRFSAFDPDHWWESRGGTRTEIEEMEKLLLDLVRHPIG